MKESLKWNAMWKIEKYKDVFSYFEGKSYEINIIKKNIALNTGINLIWTLVCGGDGIAFTEGNSFIGIGDSDAAEDITQTGLQATTNKLYKKMEPGYPTFGTIEQVNWQSVFGAQDANFDWKEFTVANGDTSSAVHLNRKVSDQGTKTAGEVWSVRLTITLA